MLVEGLIASLQPRFIDAKSAAADGYMSMMKSLMEHAANKKNVFEKNKLLEEANMKFYQNFLKEKEKQKELDVKIKNLIDKMFEFKKKSEDLQNIVSKKDAEIESLHERIQQLQEISRNNSVSKPSFPSL